MAARKHEVSTLERGDGVYLARYGSPPDLTPSEANRVTVLSTKGDGIEIIRQNGVVEMLPSSKFIRDANRNLVVDRKKKTPISPPKEEDMPQPRRVIIETSPSPVVRTPLLRSENVTVQAPPPPAQASSAPTVLVSVPRVAAATPVRTDAVTAAKREYEDLAEIAKGAIERFEAGAEAARVNIRACEGQIEELREAIRQVEFTMERHREDLDHCVRAAQKAAAFAQ